MIKRFVTIVTLLVTVLNAQAADRIKVAPIPEGVETMDEFTVKVRPAGGEWMEVGTMMFLVNATQNTRKTSVSKFEFEGKVEVAVTSKHRDIQSFKVRPLSFGIDARQEGRTITFILDCPRYLSVEVNGDIFNNLQLFADNILEIPNVKKRDLIYFGPGYHVLEKDSLYVPSGKTVFIDNGAVIRGNIIVKGVRDVKVLGHGVIKPQKFGGIQVQYSKKVLIDGPLTHQIPVGGSDSVQVRNAKSITWFGWGDGMNIFASNNVSYKHVFCRNSDDCSTIYCTRKEYHGGCRNILIEDATYWADMAHPIMIGLHSETDEDEVIENVVYRNVNILDQAENQLDYQGCIAINDGDNVLVRNVLFSDFHIESLRKGMLVNMRVCFNKKYCRAPGRGIKDITLRNITYTGAEPNMGLIVGYNEQRSIDNVRFENLRINGKLISDDMKGKPGFYKTADMANFFIGEHVNNVTFVK